VVVVIGAIATLYFAREILVPFAFALTLTFLLTPVVALLQRLHTGRAKPRRRGIGPSSKQSDESSHDARIEKDDSHEKPGSRCVPPAVSYKVRQTHSLRTAAT